MSRRELSPFPQLTIRLSVWPVLRGTNGKEILSFLPEPRQEVLKSRPGVYE